MPDVQVVPVPIQMGPMNVMAYLLLGFTAGEKIARLARRTDASSHGTDGA